MHSGSMRSASRAASGFSDDAMTPRSRGARIVNYFSSKLDRVARLMSGGCAWPAKGCALHLMPGGCWP